LPDNFLTQILKKNTSNKKVSFLRSVLIICSAAIFTLSCNPTKYVPQDETLLNDNKIIVNKEGIKKSALVPYIKQKPNKRIFGTRFHLALYNLSNIKKQKWPNKWLRDIGEEPVIFDPAASAKSVSGIKSYIFSKGYFDSHVMETIETASRKTKVYYNVDLLPPYTIRNIYYDIADTTVKKLFYFDSVNCLIERGKPYDVDILQAELKRFERVVKDRGYYGFSGENIFFKIDSSIGKREVNIYYGIKNFLKLDSLNNPVFIPHQIFRVRNVYIYPDYVPKDALERGEEYLKSLDTINYKDYFIVTPEERPKINYDVILQALYIKPGATFNVTNTEQSQNHLLSLKTYRLVNIFYNDIQKADTNNKSEMLLDCNIQLTLLSQQSFKVELEGTNSAGNLGGALNLIYQHKNLFHGAELFNLKLKGAYEATSQLYTNIRSTQEYGIETSVRFPTFLFPLLKKEGFIKKYNPTTTLLAAYNYQDNPFYTRTLANSTFGYNWNVGSYKTNIVNPLQLNIVKLLRIDSAYQKMIESSRYLVNAYRSVMILGGNYSFIFNNQKIQKSKDYWFLRINAETAGNMLSLASTVTGKKKPGEGYKIFGQPFAQYVKADIDVRYNVIVNDLSSIVYRGFIGAGIPYGNSKAIPFEKQYYSGGANGIRAWQVRSLGPGSFRPDTTVILNQTSDIKIEANAEYRFKLFWILEGALFLDVGNIWSYRYDPTTPGSQFQIKNFYKDLAVGTGTGLRFNFKFVMGRVDLGMKLRDPWMQSGSKWIFLQRPYSLRNDFNLVLAIGYPF
jgi:outer membrane protein assembly factor BamA